MATLRTPGLGLLLLAVTSVTVHAAGARLYKSGPIQITADGRYVWAANTENRSVTRLDTWAEATRELDVSPCQPSGLAVRDDGSEAWIACPDQDELLVVSSSLGVIIARLAVPWGSAPTFVALSPDQQRAVVTFHRGDAVGVVDTGGRRLVARLASHRAPLGVAFTADGRSAWVTHAFSAGDSTFVSEIDLAGATPRLAAQPRLGMQEPQVSTEVEDYVVAAEGGAVTFRGHLAPRPGSDELWVPAQHHGLHDTVPNPDSTVLAAIHKLRLSEKTFSVPDRLVVSAPWWHGPTGTDVSTRAGWDAHVAGPIDLAFSRNGDTAYVLHENSNDLLVVPTSVLGCRPSWGSDELVEIDVGERPLGLVVSPVADVAFVYNALTRDVSVVDLVDLHEVGRVPATPRTGLGVAAALVEGARLFHSSVPREISVNQKIACGSCHGGGEHDGLVWDSQNLPPGPNGRRLGPRATTSMLGLSRTFAGRDRITGLGQLHRSGDRDELQDFNFTYVGAQMGGTGFFTTAPCPPRDYADTSAGVDPRVDNMAAYVMALRPLMRSPHRGAGGALAEAAVRGAGLFSGTGNAAGDARCITCHDPRLGFADRGFHDVGSARPEEEVELSIRAPTWHVNTPTLVGLWNTAPYDNGGSSGPPRQHVVDVLTEMASRGPFDLHHGRPGSLTGRQLDDLAAFVLSIDGSTGMPDTQVVDTTPPLVVRVDAVSLSRLEVFFSEAVERGSAESLSNWSVSDETGTFVPVLDATWDPREGDRVSLLLQTPRRCEGRVLTVTPGRIMDMAGSVRDREYNALDQADLSNVHSVAFGDTITVTLGASGRETITVPVHDAAMSVPEEPGIGHDAPWLRAVAGQPSAKGFVRFAWRDAFVAATGVSSSDAIVDASVTLHPQWGVAQRVQVRRVLRPWSDARGGDGNASPTAAPTWTHHAWPAFTWGLPGAGLLGGSGSVPEDYDGRFDLSATVEAEADVAALGTPVVLGGPAMTAAYRFFQGHPDLDFGHALELAEGSSSELRFRQSEEARGRYSPVLTITYRLPSVIPTAPEVSAVGSSAPLLVRREAEELRLSFEALGATTYQVLEGEIGWFASHALAACASDAVTADGRTSLVHRPSPGQRYVLVAANGPCGGDLGVDSDGIAREQRRATCW